MHSLNPSTQEARGRQISVGSRPDWSTESSRTIRATQKKPYPGGKNLYIQILSHLPNLLGQSLVSTLLGLESQIPPSMCARLSLTLNASGTILRAKVSHWIEMEAGDRQQSFGYSPFPTSLPHHRLEQTVAHSRCCTSHHPLLDGVYPQTALRFLGSFLSAIWSHS